MSLLDFLRPQGAQMPGAMSQPRQSGLSMLMGDKPALMAMAGQLMSQNGNMANIGNALQAAGPVMAQTRQKNATVEMLKVEAPDIAQAIESGALTPSDGYKAYFDRKKGVEPPTSVQEFQYGLKNPAFNQWQTDQKRAGAAVNNVTVGGGKYGTIPQGYELVEGPEGATLRPMLGGPEDTTKKDALAAGQADVATRVVTSAASRAREAAKNRQMGGFGQGVMSNLPWTDSAEVSRQVDVLKSTAKVENLTAMRAASPTGGALGSVTEKEADMLASKSGALDPSSPTFERDLDDYELTLLQVVHGPQEGTRIWQETRGGGGGPAMPAQQPQGGGNTTRTGVQWSVGP